MAVATRDVNKKIEKKKNMFRFLFQAYGGGAFGPTAGGPGGGPGGGGGGGGGGSGGSGGVEGATYSPDSPYFPFGARGVPVTVGTVSTPTPVVNPATPIGTNGARLPNPAGGESFVIALSLSR